MTSSAKVDRRVERTRDNVVSAFRTLLFERGFAAVSVRDVITRANVGRSTFYEHFQNKEEVLHETFAPVLAPLADALAAPRVTESLRFVVQHVVAHRDLVPALLAGPARRVALRLLSDLLEQRIGTLPPHRRTGTPLLAPPRAAAFLAETQLTLIAQSLDVTSPPDADALATALHATTNAIANALFVR
jgi:AcrR family transcriptional regulator